MDKLLSSKEAADYLGVTVRTLKRWQASGKLTPCHSDCHGDRHDKFYTLDQLSRFVTVSTEYDNHDKHDKQKQPRVAQAQLFFDSLYGNVTGEFWGYLWTATQDNRHTTYPFKVTDAEQRAQMAKRAIELSDKGLTVYFGVNLLSEKPSPYERAKNATVAIQVAVICDIDIVGGTHEQSDKKIYAPDFDTAKSFLPFATSFVVNSGYGLHAYCIFAEPLTITDENRQAANRRNVGFIKVIRNRAGDYGKTADGVGDLARVLRVPGTFNYKLGVKDDSPLCRIVEANDVRFSPADLDERIAALLPKPQEPTSQPKINQPPRRAEPIDRDELDKPTEQERAIAMLPFIKIGNGDHDRWVHVGMILKANGNTLSDWERWSATQPNYTPDKHGYSCAEKWATFPDTCAMTIATLHEWAIEGGYSEKEFLREWYDQHPNSKSYRRARQVSDLTTKDKIPDCPVDLILPRDVLFNDEGITLVESRRDDKPRYITAATTPIVPTKILRDETSGLVQYELAILTQGTWRRHVVDGRTIQSPRCIDKLANFGALIKPTPLCEYFTRIIAANSERLKMWRVFAQPGWKDDKFQQFIYPTGGENYIVDRAGYKYKTDYSERGNADEWRQIFGEAMKAGGRIARIFCGVAVAAPLIRPLKVTNMQAHLFGGVNAGKTVLARLIASIWGNPQDLLMTFESSPKRRQADAAAYNDLPTIYDELETVRGQRAEMSLTQSVYAFFNGKGNQNLNVDGTARDTFKFTGSRLSTGERQILKVADQYGAYKRLVPIECKGKIFAKQLATRIFRFTEDNFGHFGREWTTYIADHLTAIRDKYEALEVNLLADEIHEETQLRTICAAGVAYQFFAQYVGLQDEFDDSTFMADVAETIDELPTVEESSDSARALDVLKDFVTSNEGYFYIETANNDAREYPPTNHGVNYGKLFLDGGVAFIPTELRKILYKEGFASPEMLIRTWNGENKIETTAGRGTYRRHRINKKLTDTIYFKPKILSEPREDKADDNITPPPI